MQQGAQYGEAPPPLPPPPPQYARPSSTSANPTTAAGAATTTHPHVFGPSHEVAAASAAGIGLSSNSPSITNTAAAAATAGHHQHAAGAPAPHSYSLGQAAHQHQQPLQQQQQQQQQPAYLHFQEHLSHHHHQSLPSSSHSGQQQQLLDHSAASAPSSSSSAGLHLHQQSLQKQAMVPSISMNLQQRTATGQEAQQQMQQSSMLQQQYTHQQHHNLGLGLDSPKPSIATLQQAAKGVQQQQPHAVAASSPSSATTSAALPVPATNVMTHSSALHSNLMSSTTSGAVTPSALTALSSSAGAGQPAEMSDLQQIAVASTGGVGSITKQDGGRAGGEAAASGMAEDQIQDALGYELEKGGSGGNRWPRQETLALLKVRSDMDSSFRDSSLKRPLWDEVSRKLAELGYHRSAKKCKEKFENLHKYYKRTKEGKAGRQDGKSYRFFSELEALYGNAGTNQNRSDVGRSTSGFLLGSSLIGAPMGISDFSARMQSAGPTGIRNLTSTYTATFVRPLATDASGLNFSSDTSTSDDDDEHTDEYEDPSDVTPENKKRKRKTLSRMMAFFESLLKQVMEKQEQMQQRFLDALERREQDRMIREEAWKRQEMARMSRENELRAQERSLAATRDAAIVAFLQKVTGQAVQLPTTSTPATQLAITPALSTVQAHASPMPLSSAPLDPTFHHHIAEDQDPFDPNSKRWPKPEVLALIKLRTSLHSRFTEPGPKGPLWEDIASGMARLGYNRNAKRCKEKWENINKYFKKAKESNKNRPENAKTCPYYHQLDALYKQGVLGSANVGSSIKALPYRHSSANLDKADNNPMQLHLQASVRIGREGEQLVAAHGSKSTEQVLAIMPSASLMSVASADAAASTGNVPANAAVANVNTAAAHNLFVVAGSNPDSSVGEINISCKDVNLQNVGDISPAKAVDVNSESKLGLECAPSRVELSEGISMKTRSLQMQHGIVDNSQQPHSISNQGYIEHKVDLEQDARQTDEDVAHQKQHVLLQQQQQHNIAAAAAAAHQAHVQQFQQGERVPTPLTQLQGSSTTTSFIANMLQKFNNDPGADQSNTSTNSTN